MDTLYSNTCMNGNGYFNEWSHLCFNTKCTRETRYTAKISDAHEWINEIPTVPIYYLVTLTNTYGYLSCILNFALSTSGTEQVYI